MPDLSGTTMAVRRRQRPPQGLGLTTDVKPSRAYVWTRKVPKPSRVLADTGVGSGIGRSSYLGKR